MWIRQDKNNGQLTVKSVDTFQNAAVMTSRKHRKILGNMGDTSRTSIRKRAYSALYTGHEN
jgi:hypothetical protein